MSEMIAECLEVGVFGSACSCHQVKTNRTVLSALCAASVMPASAGDIDGGAAAAHLHNVHHFVQCWHTHISPAEVIEANLCSHEELWVVCEATAGQVAWPTALMLADLQSGNTLS